MNAGINPASFDWGTIELLQYLLPRIFFSVLCGGIIGLERELKNKAAGIKTNILICLGASLYTGVSQLVHTGILSSLVHLGNEGTVGMGDPTRIAAQVVSGIGFLGVGTIIQSRGTVQGLTTAATIWVVAAIGVFIGLGVYSAGVIAAVSVILILVGTNFFEDKVLARAQTYVCEVTVDDREGRTRSLVHEALKRHELTLDDFHLSTNKEGHSLLSIRYTGQRAGHKRLILDLWGIPGMIEVRHH